MCPGVIGRVLFPSQLYVNYGMPYNWWCLRPSEIEFIFSGLLAYGVSTKGADISKQINIPCVCFPWGACCAWSSAEWEGPGFGATGPRLNPGFVMCEQWALGKVLSLCFLKSHGIFRRIK